jgi:hypothetical protein
MKALAKRVGTRNLAQGGTESAPKQLADRGPRNQPKRKNRK